MKKMRLYIVFMVVVFVCAVNSDGFINPSFTPNDLVEQSEIVLVIDFSNVAEDGMATGKVLRSLKGEFDDEQLELDLLAGAFEAQGRMVMRLLEDGGKEVLLFAGSYENGGGEMEEDDILRRGYIHVAGKWASVSQWDDGLWEMEKIDPLMLGTFAGGTDMLLRAVDYILGDPYATLPVNSGVQWDEPMKVGVVSVDAVGLSAVDISGRGKADLFVAGASGDRVFRWVDKGFVDVTQKLGLGSKSRVYAWGDYDGNGRIDLGSWDGEQLAVSYQQVGGGFVVKGYDVADVMGGEYLGLTTIDAGGGRAGIVGCGNAKVALFSFDKDGEIVTGILNAGDIDAQELGDGGGCIAADFDNDGKTDIVKLFASDSVYYKGKGTLDFEVAKRMGIGAGDGVKAVCLGDYDADGLLDVFMSGERRNQLWQNLGGMNFVDRLEVSGEISYISKPGGVTAMTGDINNDGRQDVLIAYGGEMTPHLFFNRGFRSFGHARMVDLQELKMLPEAGGGQLAGGLGDYNDDGAVDMVLVLKNGEVWFLPRLVEDYALSAWAVLSPGVAGPRNVWGSFDGRPLGVWSVRFGEMDAFFGSQEPGPVMIQWRGVNGEVGEEEVIVEDGPVRVHIAGE